MRYSIGIDLGTTNSVVAIARRGGVETVPIDGKNVTPSAIAVKPDGTVVVGHPARSRARLDPTSAVTSAKRKVGDNHHFYEIGGKRYTPVDVGAQVLRRLKQGAEEYLGGAVTDAVVTVPAYFDNIAKQNTKTAAEAAGLRVRRLVPEPTAAAIAYGMGREADQVILVYDLGGGTFDVSVLRVKKREFEVLAVEGDATLGGDDFDSKLAWHLSEELSPGPERDLLRTLLSGIPSPAVAACGRMPDLLHAAGRLRDAAEQAKIELSDPGISVTEVNLPGILGQSIHTEISRETYNGLIAPWIDRTIELVQKALKAGSLTKAHVGRIVLVGGSTRNLLVRERLTDLIKEPYIADRVDEVVAQGAAYVAAEGIGLAEFVSIDVTPFDLGVRARSGADRDHFKPLIRKNSRVPVEAQETFTTAQPNQEAVEIAVFQGDKPHCKENTFLGRFRLDGIPPANAGEPDVTVLFRMDESDLLTVAATCRGGATAEKTLNVHLVSREDEPRPVEKPRADIMFLIDTSGSMSGELAGVKQSCLDFAHRVESLGVECRLGLVDFDKGWFDAYKWDVFPPTDPNKLRSSISKLEIGRLGGCGCYIGDPGTLEVIEAFAAAFPSEQRLKIGILISDEVGNDSKIVDKIIATLKRHRINLHVLGVDNSCHVQIAKATGGSFWDIKASPDRSADFAKVLDAMAVRITDLALRP